MRDDPKDLSLRVVKVETTVSTLSEDVEKLSRSVEKLGNNLSEQIQSLAKDYQSSRLPDYRLVLGALGILISVISSIGGMALVPLYHVTSELKEMAVKSADWQMDYMKGNMPSPASTEIVRVDSKLQGELATQSAAVNEKLKEIETQFKGMDGRVTENYNHIEIMLNRQMENREHITRLEERAGIRP